MASLSLQAMYSQYLANYAHSLHGRVESQKKNDSKDVYHSIIKLNKNSPLYVQNFSDTAKSSALNLKEQALLLKGSLSPFLNDSDYDSDAFRSAYNTEDSIADIKYTPGYSKSSVKEFDLQVQQLASKQINRGEFLSDMGKNLSDGTHSFTISQGNTNYELELDITPEDDNLSIQKRIASMINRAPMSIEASLISSGGNRHALQLSSTEAGLPKENDYYFTVSENKKSGQKGIVSQLGIDFVSQFPKDAKFTINGTAFENGKNTIALNNGFEITLKAVSDKVAHISLQDDYEGVSSKISEFVSTYNNSIDLLGTQESTSTSTSVLSNKMTSLIRGAAPSLSEIGITVDSNNKLSFSKEEFLKKVSNTKDTLKDILNPLDSFSKRITNTMDQVILNPFKYTENVIAAYKNVSKENYSTPYANSSYSGMYFNYFC